MGQKDTIAHAVSAYLAMSFHESVRSAVSGLADLLVARIVYRLGIIEYWTLGMRLSILRVLVYRLPITISEKLTVSSIEGALRYPLV